MALAKGELCARCTASFNIAGLPTTFGNRQWKDNIATSNAVLVDRQYRLSPPRFPEADVGRSGLLQRPARRSEPYMRENRGRTRRSTPQHVGARERSYDGNCAHQLETGSAYRKFDQSVGDPSHSAPGPPRLSQQCQEVPSRLPNMDLWWRG
jgi:hypothetical protein